MEKQSWSSEELAVAVYFSSRKAGHEACARILARKLPSQHGIARTAQSVRSKLDKVRAIDGLWDDKVKWHLDAVDRWLVDDLDVGKLEMLVSLDQEELAMIPQASSIPHC